MDIRRTMMGVIAQMGSEWRQKEFIVTTRLSNTKDIADALLNILPSFSMAFAYKDRDYNEIPYDNNCCELWGINSQYVAAARFRGDAWQGAPISYAYDGIASVGEKYIIMYK